MRLRYFEILLMTAATFIYGIAHGQEVVSSRFFGLHIHGAVSADRAVINWPDFTFGSWRLWDAGVAWYALEPKPGKWNFTLLDAYVENAERHNVQILLPLAMPPQWASARPFESNPYGAPGASAEPADMSAWRDYVSTVARRYKGRIFYYEIWNEPQDKRFFSGDVQALVNLTQQASEVLKSIDPSIKLVSPSITGEGVASYNYLSKFFQAGGGQFVDVIGYHFYTPNKDPEGAIENITAVKQIMTVYGQAGKPLWNTETGWQIEEAGLKPGLREKGWHVLDQNQDSVSYVARAYIIEAALGVQRFYWYAWDDASMGMVNLPGHTDKPMVQAYVTVERWLTNNRVSDCGKSNGIWACSITDSNGVVSHVVWSESDDQTSQGQSIKWNPPVDWKIGAVENLWGQKLPYERSGVLEITKFPLRLASSGS